MSAGIKLAELFDDLVAPVAELVVADITTDSRNVRPGTLFLACQGFEHHGLEFLEQALANGATVVAWEPAKGVAEPDDIDGVVLIEVPELGLYIGGIADQFFGQPSAHTAVTGITGTNGKTTVAWLVAQACDLLGRKAGYMGTVGYGFTNDLSPAALTTPGVIAVHRHLRAMTDADATDVVMEVSSHGLDQGRVDGVRFKTAAFTNLTRDHLDYHGSLEAYAQAKAALFTDFQPEIAVLNVADEFGRELARLLHKDVHLLSVSADPRCEAALSAELLQADSSGLQIRFSGDYGDAELHSPLWGSFNVENLAVAAGILLSLGIDLADAVAALAQCKPPAGRMEPVAAATEQPLVIIDFAHTPDALDKALTCVRQHCDGTLWCVFGCGGHRDTGKRAPMGAIAAKLADKVILTDDNPRDEVPAAIIADIVSGFPEGSQPEVIHDRAAAIAAAVAAATAGDVVLVAGKGDEDYQLAGTQRLSFSDRVAAQTALSQAGTAGGGVQ